VSVQTDVDTKEEQSEALEPVLDQEEINSISEETEAVLSGKDPLLSGEEEQLLLPGGAGSVISTRDIQVQVDPGLLTSDRDIDVQVQTEHLISNIEVEVQVEPGPISNTDVSVQTDVDTKEEQNVSVQTDVDTKEEQSEALEPVLDQEEINSISEETEAVLSGKDPLLSGEEEQLLLPGGAGSIISTRDIQVQVDPGLLTSDRDIDVQVEPGPISNTDVSVQTDVDTKEEQSEALEPVLDQEEINSISEETAAVLSGKDPLLSGEEEQLLLPGGAGSVISTRDIQVQVDPGLLTSNRDIDVQVEPGPISNTDVSVQTDVDTKEEQSEALEPVLDQEEINSISEETEAVLSGKDPLLSGEEEQLLLPGGAGSVISTRDIQVQVDPGLLTSDRDIDVQVEPGPISNTDVSVQTDVDTKEEQSEALEPVLDQEEINSISEETEAVLSGKDPLLSGEEEQLLLPGGAGSIISTRDIQVQVDPGLLTSDRDIDVQVEPGPISNTDVSVQTDVDTKEEQSEALEPVLDQEEINSISEETEAVLSGKDPLLSGEEEQLLLPGGAGSVISTRDIQVQVDPGLLTSDRDIDVQVEPGPISNTDVSVQTDVDTKEEQSEALEPVLDQEEINSISEETEAVLSGKDPLLSGEEEQLLLPGGAGSVISTRDIQVQVDPGLLTSNKDIDVQVQTEHLISNREVEVQVEPGPISNTDVSVQTDVDTEIEDLRRKNETMAKELSNKQAVIVAYQNQLVDYDHSIQELKAELKMAQEKNDVQNQRELALVREKEALKQELEDKVTLDEEHTMKIVQLNQELEKAKKEIEAHDELKSILLAQIEDLKKSNEERSFLIEELSLEKIKLKKRADGGSC
ncbi:putative protein tag-278, partial [Palaemon carinicauda]|uniref:putative protein tag-278 n=1 Tax=Palaemon carinicauda TaxID=392227 RepID=UPI0035B6617A